MAIKQKNNQVRLACAEHADAEDEYHALISTWLLRMLLGSASAFKGFFEKKRGFMDSDIQEFLNFSDKDDEKIKISELKSFMRDQLKAHEKQVDRSGLLFTNIALMAKRIPLTIIS